MVTEDPSGRHLLHMCKANWVLLIIIYRFLSLQLGRRMAEFPVEPMMSKMLIASEKYVKETTFDKFPHFFFFS